MITNHTFESPTQWPTRLYLLYIHLPVHLSTVGNLCEKQGEAMALLLTPSRTLQYMLKLPFGYTQTAIAAAALRPVANLSHQLRRSSHSPLGAPAAKTRRKVTIDTIRALYKKDEPITMITAHDFPSAHVADHAGMDIVLVGDSLAMVALGMEDTSEVVLEEMILHCRSVARATKSAFTVSLVPTCALATTSMMVPIAVFVPLTVVLAGGMFY